MAIAVLDAALCFGQRTIAAGSFPDILNLGRKDGSADHYPNEETTSVDRLTVDVHCESPSGGTSMTVTVEGSADGATGWKKVGENIFTLDEMQSSPCCTAISPNKLQYLRVTLAVDGEFEGSAKAYLNTYMGK